MACVENLHAAGGAVVLETNPGPARGAPVAARHAQHVWETTTDRTASMLQDISAAVQRYPLWVRLGWQDVLLRYWRSLLGPFWLTLSMGVMIATLGSIYSDILRLPTVQYLPYLATGIIVWGLISALVSEGCQTFIESDWLIRQIDLPLAMFPMRVVWRNFIVFLHNVAIYLLLLMVLPIPIRWATLTAIPALLLLLSNGLWCGILLGMMSARFRDLPQIVSSLMQVAFFATPIIWSADALSGKTVLVTANPFFHLIEIVRSPLIGRSVPVHSWIVTCVISLAGWTMALLVFRHFHRRISYWV
jgi:ABC-type polysaccharide/polyol phosphate export permease